MEILRSGACEAEEGIHPPNTIGMYLRGSNEVASNSIGDLDGPNAVGVYIESGAFETSFEDNTIDGEPIRLYSGASGVVSDLVVRHDRPFAHTNLGDIAFINPAGVILEGANITSATSTAIGIFGEGDFVMNNSAIEILEYGEGLRADGVGSLFVELTGNRFAGCSTCVRVSGAATVLLSEANSLNPQGGEGNCFGFQLDSLEYFSLLNERIYNIETTGCGHGVFLENGASGTIENSTIHGISGDPSCTSGVHRDTSDVSVDVTSTIVSDVSGVCLYNNGDDGTGLEYTYSNLYECSEGFTHGTVDGGDNSYEDPLFVSPETGDLHLQPESLCVDTGDEDADYSLEPSPNGCRVNMGAYGNTDEATSAVGASDCE